MLVLGTPELAHEVLHASPGSYLAGAANRRILPVLPANTLLTLDGEAHRERRGELAPLFHGDSLEAITPVIRDVSSRELERWPLGRPFAVLPRMRRLPLSVAARLILGVRDGAEIDRLEGCLARVPSPTRCSRGGRRQSAWVPLARRPRRGDIDESLRAAWPKP
jgi:cytochrome P450